MAAVAILALTFGCNKKKADKPAEPVPVPVAVADAAPPPPVADAAPVPGTVDAAPTTAPPAVAGKAVCCESTGDATHDTLELSEATCKDDLDGDVVDMKDCDVKGDVPILAADQGVAIAAPGQYVAWKGTDGNQLVVCDLRFDAKDATVKCKGGGDKWKKAGKAAIADGATLTFIPRADGTAILSNGASKWTLAAEYRYGDVAMKESAK